MKGCNEMYCNEGIGESLFSAGRPYSHTIHQTPDTRHDTPDTRQQTPYTGHQTPDTSVISGKLFPKKP